MSEALERRRKAHQASPSTFFQDQIIFHDNWQLKPSKMLWPPGISKRQLRLTYQIHQVQSAKQETQRCTKNKDLRSSMSSSPAHPQSILPSQPRLRWGSRTRWGLFSLEPSSAFRRESSNWPRVTPTRTQTVLILSTKSTTSLYTTCRTGNPH